MITHEFDVLILGCGIAGLTAGIKLAEKKLKIGIVTQETDPLISNTYWAQGGIITNHNEAKGVDSPLQADILKAGANTSNIEAIKVLVNESSHIFNEILLDKAQTNFTTDDNGELKLTKEAAHSLHRIAYKGDFTGKEISTSLMNYLKDKTRFPTVSFLCGHTAIDLITPNHHGATIAQRYESDRILGAYLFHPNGQKVLKAMANTTILATGGIGSLYLHHSNAEGARGDGHAMAKRAGAQLINMEFVQFHPTTFYDRSSHRRFLISEAIRGEGGILINASGERFMEKYHLEMEMAPRDIVARAIAQEMVKSQNACVYLDISHKDSAWIRQRFPTIYEHCLSHQVDMGVGPIPVVPAAHYSCGGVRTNLYGQTNLDSLYAIGEVACTGLHGANRLASTSLLECLTFGYRAACHIIESINQKSLYDADLINDWDLADGECDNALISQDWMTLKQTMWNYVGLIRSTHRLNRANAILSQLSNEVHRFYRNSRLQERLIGLRNAIEVSQLVLHSSIRNKKSVGCFFREN